MHPEVSAERTAEVLCAELCELRDLAGAAVVAFTADDVAVPLGIQGTPPAGLRSGVPLPPGTATRLRANARTGPWVETVDGAVAWAPFGPAGEPLGVLALLGNGGPRVAAATGNLLLAAAIDFAAVAGGLVTPALLAGGAHEARAHLAEVLRRQAFSPVFQPIVALATGAVLGFEALTRFTDGTAPQARFAEAAALNRGIDLETATLAAALRAASGLPPGCWVSVNVSPALVLERHALPGLITNCGVQVVLEITEHDPVTDYVELSTALAELRPLARLSVDDAGSGFASLRHVVTLEPEFVKLDQSWVAGIDDDHARQALVAGLSHFAGKTGSVLIAEGVETAPERGMLQELEVDMAQGFLFGRPRPAGAR
ncbi:MAG: EAL domain-containing protein [Acidimicrobiales bacterium]